MTGGDVKRDPRRLQPQEVEQFSRHLRAKGVRVRIGATQVPEGWLPDQELLNKIRPQDQKHHI